MTHPTESGAGGELIRLPEDHIAPDPVLPPPSRHAGGHGIVVTMMAVFALLGIAAMFAFITVQWPDDFGRYVMAVFVGSVVGFISCASLAVFTAARQMSSPPPAGEDDTAGAAH